MNKLNKLNIEKLELDYTEASELFSTETLSAMQMAKVNGGNAWAKLAQKVAEWVGAALAEEITRMIIGHFEKGDGTTLGEDDIEFGPTGFTVNETSYEIRTDSIIYNPDGTVKGIYGLNITPTQH